MNVSGVEASVAWPDPSIHLTERFVCTGHFVQVQHQLYQDGTMLHEEADLVVKSIWTPFRAVRWPLVSTDLVSLSLSCLAVACQPFLSLEQMLDNGWSHGLSVPPLPQRNLSSTASAWCKKSLVYLNLVKGIFTVALHRDMQCDLKEEILKRLYGNANIMTVCIRSEHSHGLISVAQRDSCLLITFKRKHMHYSSHKQQKLFHEYMSYQPLS